MLCAGIGCATCAKCRIKTGRRHRIIRWVHNAIIIEIVTETEIGIVDENRRRFVQACGLTCIKRNVGILACDEHKRRYLVAERYAAVEHHQVQTVRYRGTGRHSGRRITVATAEQCGKVGAANTEHTNGCPYFIIGGVFPANRARDRAEAAFDKIQNAAIVITRDDGRAGRAFRRGVNIFSDLHAAVWPDRDFSVVNHQELGTRSVSGDDEVLGEYRVTFLQ